MKFIFFKKINYFFKNIGSNSGNIAKQLGIFLPDRIDRFGIGQDGVGGILIRTDTEKIFVFDFVGSSDILENFGYFGVGIDFFGLGHN